MLNPNIWSSYSILLLAGVFMIVLFDLYAMVMSVAGLNLSDKNIKGWHHLSGDGKIFLLTMSDHCP